MRKCCGIQTACISSGLKWYIKWQVGRTYAVVPKRGEYTIWYKQDENGVMICDQHGISDNHGLRYSEEDIPKGYLSSNGFKPLRIRITAIRQESLQDITEADAIAEGCLGYEPKQIYVHISDYHKTSFPGATPVKHYSELWDSINNRKGARWEDNPLVWVLTFEVAKA